jgi:hypothetical protein
MLTCRVARCIAALNSVASPIDGPAPAENELALASPELPSVKDPGREPVLLRWLVPARRTSWWSSAVLSGPIINGAEGRSRSCSAGDARCAGGSKAACCCGVPHVYHCCLQVKHLGWTDMGAWKGRLQWMVEVRGC